MCTVTTAMRLKDTCFLEESYAKPREHIKKQRYHFVDKSPSSQSYGFSSSHVKMWELDHKEGWVSKNWFFQIVEKTLESPLNSKEIQAVNPKRNQHWIFIGRTDVEAETPILRPPDVKNWLTEIKPINPREINSIFTESTDAEVEALILWPLDVKSWIVGKAPVLGKIESRRRRGLQRMKWLDGIVDTHGHVFEPTPGDSEGQGNLVCCSSWVVKSQSGLSDWTTIPLYIGMDVTSLE